MHPNEIKITDENKDILLQEALELSSKFSAASDSRLTTKLLVPYVDALAEQMTRQNVE